MLFVEYPKCTTCKRAKKWLDDHNLNYTDRHIKEENPTAEELKAWHKQSGLPLKKFFNTSGLLYKELKLKDKLPTMSEEEQYELLEMNRISGFIDRARGTGRPTKKDRRSLEEFVTPEYFSDDDDFDFDFDFEE